MYSLDNVYSQQFFARKTTAVARDLLGAILCRRLPGGAIIAGKIVETEAYRDNEPASHAARGPTPRCRIMFGPPGFSYVYFIYGTNHCFNVVTEPEGKGCAVLIRAIEGSSTNGPGKLCKQLEITRELNGVSLLRPESEIWIAQGDALKRSDIGVSARIGITAAVELPWRYFIKGHKGVSGPKSLNSNC